MKIAGDNENVPNPSNTLALARAVLNFQHLIVQESMMSKDQKNITTLK
jgi:hypothetical protein